MIHTSPQSSAENLAKMAQEILPKNVSVATGDLILADQILHSQEQVFIQEMHPKRQIEFVCGRNTARRALAPLGYGDVPIFMARDRAPVWPENVVGSLSHSATACIALAAFARDFVALGVDLEKDYPLDNCLISEVCNEEEIRWLLDQPCDKRGQLAKLIFSAKEAIYKAQYPLTKALFGFERLSVCFDFSKGQFSAKFTAAIAGFEKNHCLNGCFQIGNGLILTTVALTSSDWKG